MGYGLRRHHLLILITVLFALGLPVAAQEMTSEVVACWVEDIEADLSGTVLQVTRCRLSGGEIIDYEDEWEVPVDLEPNLGIDGVGPCWFLTSRSTPFVIVQQFANGDALIGYVPDPNQPGNWIAVENYRRCTSEPEEESDQETRVWEYVHAYLHDPPVPELNPRVGDGVAGLATYLGTSVPPPHQAVLTGGTTTLEVEIDVVAVIVDWGDLTEISFPPNQRMLSGYPDGAAWHIYQAKSEDLAVSVSYRWGVRWRVIGGPWMTLLVPNSTTTVAYPIAEIVSVLGD